MSEHSRRKKAREVLTRSGYKVGGHLSAKADEAQDKHEIESAVRRGISEHEAHDHKGEKRTRIHLRDGGMAGGGAPMGRPDKKARKGKTEVNVMVAPQGGGSHPVPVPVPHPVPVAPPAGMPPQGAGLSPAGPPGLRPGMGGLKTGGRAKMKVGKFEGGAGNGVGRMEKAEHEAKRSHR